jgi:hypothetical protein
MSDSLPLVSVVWRNAEVAIFIALGILMNAQGIVAFPAHLVG